ncbi:MAG: iron-sulfur cluster assembly accessory protein [Deltaproteobacteria bacterium]|jgi:iron-sulfur cluster assembly protein|nr:iron-sulfur cluster assembly accessory protein [Deltaproteobacteria bacterium]
MEHSEKTTEAVVKLTDKAIAMVKEVLQNEGLEGYGLRVVAMQGCCGVQYGLDFDDTANEGDEVVELDGFKVYVDIDSVSVLRGSTIDYVSDVHGSGFKFLNPNVQEGTCGCGNCGGCN